MRCLKNYLGAGLSLILVISLASCGGSGGGSGSTAFGLSGTGFGFSEIFGNTTGSGTANEYPILDGKNIPIILYFNEPIDPSSVSSASINVKTIYVPDELDPDGLVDFPAGQDATVDYVVNGSTLYIVPRLMFPVGKNQDVDFGFEPKACYEIQFKQPPSKNVVKSVTGKLVTVPAGKPVAFITTNKVYDMWPGPPEPTFYIQRKSGDPWELLDYEGSVDNTTIIENSPPVDIQPPPRFRIYFNEPLLTVLKSKGAEDLVLVNDADDTSDVLQFVFREDYMQPYGFIDIPGEWELTQSSMEEIYVEYRPFDEQNAKLLTLPEDQYFFLIADGFVADLAGNHKDPLGMEDDVTTLKGVGQANLDDIVEDFSTTNFEDTDASSAEWGFPIDWGPPQGIEYYLIGGGGGGDGSFGELYPPHNPDPDISSIPVDYEYDSTNNILYLPTADSNGDQQIYNFTKVLISNGWTVKPKPVNPGDPVHPLILYATGEVQIDGTIDVSGESGVGGDVGQVPDGFAGGISYAGGAAGGQGGSVPTEVIGETMGIRWAPNLAHFGHFSQDTGVWTKETGWSIVNGVAYCDGSQPGISDLSQDIQAVEGEDYSVTLTVSNLLGGNLKVFIGDTQLGNTINTSGTHTVESIMGVSGDGVLRLRANASFVGEVDNIDVGDPTHFLQPGSGEENLLGITGLVTGLGDYWLEDDTVDFKLIEDKIVDQMLQPNVGMGEGGDQVITNHPTFFVEKVDPVYNHRIWVYSDPIHPKYKGKLNALSNNPGLPPPPIADVGDPYLLGYLKGYDGEDATVFERGGVGGDPLTVAQTLLTLAAAGSGGGGGSLEAGSEGDTGPDFPSGYGGFSTPDTLGGPGGPEGIITGFVNQRLDNVTIDIDQDLGAWDLAGYRINPNYEDPTPDDTTNDWIFKIVSNTSNTVTVEVLSDGSDSYDLTHKFVNADSGSAFIIYPPENMGGSGGAGTGIECSGTYKTTYQKPFQLPRWLNGAGGGAGGGVLILESAKTIRVAASGKILAEGGQGGTLSGLQVSLPGGGGGSGGFIMLRAIEMVEVDGVLSADGGAGGGKVFMGGQGASGFIRLENKLNSLDVEKFKDGKTIPQVLERDLGMFLPQGEESLAQSKFYNAGVIFPVYEEITILYDMEVDKGLGFQWETDLVFPDPNGIYTDPLFDFGLNNAAMDSKTGDMDMTTVTEDFKEIDIFLNDPKLHTPYIRFKITLYTHAENVGPSGDWKYQNLRINKIRFKRTQSSVPPPP